MFWRETHFHDTTYHLSSEATDTDGTRRKLLFMTTMVSILLIAIALVADTINRTSSFFLLIMMTMVMVPFIEFPAVGAATFIAATYPNNVLTPTPTPQHHEYYGKTLFEHRHHRLHSSYIPTKFASYTAFASPATRRGSSTSIELVRGGSIDETITTSKNIVSGRSNSINNHNRSSTTALFAFPQIPWFSFPNKENNNPDNYDNTLNEFGELLVQGDQAQKRNQNKPKYQPSNNSNLTNEAESTMHRAVKMMEEHRRSQEAAERTSAIMEDLASMTVVGRSKAGPSSSGGGGGGILGFGDDDAKNRGGGVKVTFNGQQRPISVNVDSKFLSSLMILSASATPPTTSSSTKSSSSSSSSTTTSSTATITSATEELNQAILDAMQDGYEKSGKIMEDKLKGLYDQLGLPKRDEK